MDTGPACRDPYFLQLQAALLAAGIGAPVLVVDRGRLRANARGVAAGLPSGMALRLVAKSLPSPGLLAFLMDGTGTDRLMSFSAAMVMDLARAFPRAPQLLGKPLATRAVAGALAGLAPDAPVTWLADTAARVAGLADLARQQGRTLSVALEIDVGLHRGGFADAPAVAAALAAFTGDSPLRFGGLMGYEPHLAKLPEAGGWQARASAAARAAYRAASRAVEQVLGNPPPLRNAAGSPTFRRWTDTTIANEVSVGSAFLKPSDFDLPDLAPFQPAAFIATPALKVSEGLRLPGLDQRDPDGGPVPALPGQAVFIHGGYWMARAVDPPGLEPSPVFGRSSNQELLLAPAPGLLAPDDFVFLRPTQSEAVLLQFGPLVVVEDGAVIDTWPTLPVSA